MEVSLRVISQHVLRLDVEKLAPNLPANNIRIALWQSLTQISIPVRIMPTQDALREQKTNRTYRP